MKNKPPVGGKLSCSCFGGNLKPIVWRVFVLKTQEGLYVWISFEVGGQKACGDLRFVLLKTT